MHAAVRARHLVLPALLVSAYLAACSSAAPVSTPAAGGGGAASTSPIKIGYMADSNGTSAPIAAGMHLATDLAVQQINAAGGINGHPLQVQYVDPQSDPTQAVQMATQLVQTDNVDVLMGAVLSSECLVVQQLVAKLQIVYLPTFGCAAEEFSSQFCNRYSFRFAPVGRQQIAPLAEYIVKTYGPRWAMAYSDYAYGTSQLNAYKAELAKWGGSVDVPIPIPQNEPNLAPYVTKVPTDGSVAGVIINGLGAGDLTRVSLALGQYGLAPKVKVIGTSGRDVYGGTYPEFLNGAVNYQTFVSGVPKGNSFGDAYEKAFKEIAQKEPEWANILGGADKILAFQGYPQYTAMTALKTAMVAAKFTGRADTEALISALEQVNLPMGPDSPGGATIMNKADHQGTQTVYVFRINGQQDELLTTVEAANIPALGNCKV
ncbi:MAG TPA: ABC transporter substrate-binding protein [Chloroflexota bacterium]|nr:ABC transporter substrate-binding protein [Chloroflexota bacterium]